MSWNAWETDKLRRQQQVTAEYQLGWTRGQTDLAAALHRGERTVEQAATYLAAHPPHPPAWQYGQGWHAGQLDLLQALRTGRITLKAAIVQLGIMLPEEVA